MTRRRLPATGQGVSAESAETMGNRAKVRRRLTQHNDHEIAESQEAGRFGGVVAQTGRLRHGVDGFNMAVLSAERALQLLCCVRRAIGRRVRDGGGGVVAIVDSGRSTGMDPVGDAIDLPLEA